MAFYPCFHCSLFPKQRQILYSFYTAQISKKLDKKGFSY
ncbi:hypothetical protein CWATWH0402_4192 [Crocosphaera watsonii WH 0402]|uniref:Uncharacterized protein n=2 Tax=Crocosphaera watsonii TaxID=263511 RepID=T2JL92_CROWT|nr:hypothetical protein CWATWH0005_1486 [Crocosphaera watsonii WH 0005]CCQ65814.1 hypothetical protein CWATWH0402_4192 [Crocosphaera watsonii WH 0402]